MKKKLSKRINALMVSFVLTFGSLLGISGCEKESSNEIYKGNGNCEVTTEVDGPIAPIFLNNENEFERTPNYIEITNKQALETLKEIVKIAVEKGGFVCDRSKSSIQQAILNDEDGNYISLTHSDPGILNNTTDTYILYSSENFDLYINQHTYSRDIREISCTVIPNDIIIDNSENLMNKVLDSVKDMSFNLEKTVWYMNIDRNLPNYVIKQLEDAAQNKKSLVGVLNANGFLSLTQQTFISLDLSEELGVEWTTIRTDLTTNGPNSDYIKNSEINLLSYGVYISEGSKNNVNKYDKEKQYMLDSVNKRFAPKAVEYILDVYNKEGYIVGRDSIDDDSQYIKDLIEIFKGSAYSTGLISNIEEAGNFSDYLSNAISISLDMIEIMEHTEIEPSISETEFTKTK